MATLQGVAAQPRWRRAITLSPLTRRRLRNFRANRRGFWSLWFFLVLLTWLGIKGFIRRVIG